MRRGSGKSVRRELAEKQKLERENRSPEEQLKLLDQRPGASVKERARLAKKE